MPHAHESLAFPGVASYVPAGETIMNSGHDERFDGLFGEEGASSPKARARKRKQPPPFAGVFGARSSPLKQDYRKSPGSMPPPAPPPEDDFEED